MSKNTANVSINVLNKARQLTGATTGLMFVIGETPFGKSWDPSVIINNITQLERNFGGVNEDNDFMLQCQNALKAGAKLRVCRVVDDSARCASVHVSEPNDSYALFQLFAKGEGEAYNQMKMIIETASNGDADAFDLRIIVDVPFTSLTIEEFYPNIEIPVGGTSAPYDYLKDVIEKSTLVDVVYADLSSYPANTLRPANGETFFTAGSAGTVEVGDYIGSSADGTGFYAFDDYDDAYIIAALGESETSMAGLYDAGKAYAALRKDLVFFSAIDNSLRTSTDIVNSLKSLTSSKFAACFGGGCKYPNTLSGGIKETLSLGELLGVVATSHTVNGVWVSPTSYVNGVFNQALGVVNNFGSPAKLADLNLIANAGGNMVVNKGGTIMQWDFYSMADGDSPEKFLTVVFLELYFVKVLKPTLEKFLTKPNTFSTWQDIYITVKPFLDRLVREEALFSYTWAGDQEAQSLEDLEVNNPTDVENGLYRIEFSFIPIVPMVEIKLDLILSKHENTVSVA